MSVELEVKRGQEFAMALLSIAYFIGEFLLLIK